MNKLEWLPEALAADGISQSKTLAELAAYHDAELGFWFLLDKESAVYNDYSLRVHPGAQSYSVRAAGRLRRHCGRGR